MVSIWSGLEACYQKDSQASLKDERKVKVPVGHSLVDDGKNTGLANDQVSPLHNDD